MARSVLLDVPSGEFPHGLRVDADCVVVTARGQVSACSLQIDEPCRVAVPGLTPKGKPTTQRVMAFRNAADKAAFDRVELVRPTGSQPGPTSRKSTVSLADDGSRVAPRPTKGWTGMATITVTGCWVALTMTVEGAAAEKVRSAAVAVACLAVDGLARAGSRLRANCRQDAAQAAAELLGFLAQCGLPCSLVYAPMKPTLGTVRSFVKERVQLRGQIKRGRQQLVEEFLYRNTTVISRWPLPAQYR